jgi:hypothetical protein
MSQSFLAAEDASLYQSGEPKQRLRATVAGAIASAVADGFIVLFLGMEESWHPEARHGARHELPKHEGMQEPQHQPQYQPQQAQQAQQAQDYRQEPQGAYPAVAAV